MNISEAKLSSYQQWYENQLITDVIPFWIQHSIDHDKGGYYTCLLRDGSVYDTDKLIWLQARQVWMFSKLYNEYEARQEWLDIALHGAAFLEQYGRDSSGSWYFSLTQSGAPLVAPYNIFSDCFACMAFAQLAIATGEHRYGDLALTTFNHIINRRDNPKGPYEKRISKTRPTKGFALPMILANLSLEIESLLDEELLQETLTECVDVILNTFYRNELGIIIENVGDQGQMLDTMDGRLVNPGHAIEACWFLMDIGDRLGDSKLIQQAVDISIRMLEYGWDPDHDGIFYFMDMKGLPMQQLEWDQKLWWVHLEAIICTLKGYAITKDIRCWQWFENLHDYSWSHFHDPEYGEWYGYLKRDGSLLNPSKGGKWKGCFHVPRGLFCAHKALERIQAGL